MADKLLEAPELLTLLMVPVAERRVLRLYKGGWRDPMKVSIVLLYKQKETEGWG